MNVTNCIRCGKLFMKVRSPLCPECLQEEEELFQKVVEYLKEHSEATIAEVATALEADMDIITKFVRSGRLASVRPAWQIHCRECGVAISSGDLCNECRSKLASEFVKAKDEKKPDLQPPKGKRANKIYLIDRVKKD